MSQEIINGKQGIGNSLSLFDLIDRILDKGLVIDAYVSLEVLGIKELVVVRARIVVASIETYLRYANAMGIYGEPGTFRAAFPREQQQQQQPQQQLQQQQQQQPQQQPQQQLQQQLL